MVPQRPLHHRRILRVGTAPGQTAKRSSSASQLVNRLAWSPVVLGCCSPTVTRKVAAICRHEGSSDRPAHQPGHRAAWHPKECKVPSGRLLNEVTMRLERLWWPDALTERLGLEFPQVPELRASHATIHQSLLVQQVGGSGVLASCPLPWAHAEQAGRNPVDGERGFRESTSPVRELTVGSGRAPGAEDSRPFTTAGVALGQEHRCNFTMRRFDEPAGGRRITTDGRIRKARRCRGY